MKNFFHIKTVDNRIYGIYSDITEEQLKDEIRKEDWLKVYTLNFVNYLEITECPIDIMTDKIVSIEANEQGRQYMEELENEYENRFSLIKDLQTYKLNGKMKFWLFIRYGFSEINANELGERSAKQLKSILDKCISTKCEKIK